MSDFTFVGNYFPALYPAYEVYIAPEDETDSLVNDGATAIACFQCLTKEISFDIELVADFGNSAGDGGYPVSSDPPNYTSATIPMSLTGTMTFPRGGITTVVELLDSLASTISNLISIFLSDIYGVAGGHKYTTDPDEETLIENYEFGVGLLVAQTNTSVETDPTIVRWGADNDKFYLPFLFGTFFTADKNIGGTISPLVGVGATTTLPPLDTEVGTFTLSYSDADNGFSFALPVYASSQHFQGVRINTASATLQVTDTLTLP